MPKKPPRPGIIPVALAGSFRIGLQDGNWALAGGRYVFDAGRYGTINELAAAERINSSYVSRLLRLTLLAPDIIEAIVDGRQPIGRRCRG
ncbi:MAG: hypothetical protein JWO26_3569 [Rhodospirillales bacterium]|nr:hypothetical protein [Rhodospirillales bacterium]